MNCKKCGNYNNDGFKFCIKCGSSLETLASDVSQTVESEQVVTEQSVLEQQPVENVVEEPEQSSVQLVETSDVGLTSESVLEQQPITVNTVEQPISVVEANSQVAPVNVVEQQPISVPSVEPQEAPTQVSNTAQQPIVDFNMVQQPTPMVNMTQKPINVNNHTLNFIKYMWSLILKPYETYKKEEDKLSNPKNGLILSVIVASVMMVINLLTSMVSSVFVKKLDFSTFEYKTEFDIAGLKDLDYLSLIGKNLLIYICIIAAIAGVYYLASLVVKKSTNFIKLLSVSASSIIPYVVAGMVLSPILGKIWFPLSLIVTFVGIIYSLIIFVLLISDNIKFEKKDLSAYFHLVCMTILGTAGYYVCMNLLVSGVGSQISDYLDLFS